MPLTAAREAPEATEERETVEARAELWLLPPMLVPAAEGREARKGSVATEDRAETPAIEVVRVEVETAEVLSELWVMEAIMAELEAPMQEGAGSGTGGPQGSVGTAGGAGQSAEAVEEEGQVPEVDRVRSAAPVVPVTNGTGPHVPLSEIRIVVPEVAEVAAGLPVRITE